MTSSREQLAALIDIATTAATSDSEPQWWELVAALVLGVLFHADVMALNVLNVPERYGWFTRVYPVAARVALPPTTPMDHVLLTDHPFSRRLEQGPAAGVMSVTELVSLRQWRGSPAYGRMRELTGGAFHLVLHFDSPLHHQESLSVVRATRDFDPGELALAAQLHAILQLGLTSLRQAARLLHGHAPADLAAAAGAARALNVTERERTVLGLVADGLDTRHIAHRLRISPRTVAKHEQNLYRKLGVGDRVNALRSAREHLLLLPTASLGAPTAPFGLLADAGTEVASAGAARRSS